MRKMRKLNPLHEFGDDSIAILTRTESLVKFPVKISDTLKAARPASETCDGQRHENLIGEEKIFELPPNTNKRLLLSNSFEASSEL